MEGKPGEIEVVKLVRCPNCKSKLMLLPANNPLYDIQCTRCIFRAQVKSNKQKPSGTIYGAGWQIMDKVLKSGFMVPMLIVNSKWTDKKGKHHEIRFYPFIYKSNLDHRKLSKTAKRADYEMFNYVGMNNLKYYVVYSKK